MLTLFEGADAVAEGARGLVRDSLAEIFAIEGGPWSDLELPMDHLVLKGPVQKYTLPGEDFLDVELARTYQPSYLFFLGRSDASQGSFQPIGTVQVGQNDAGRYRFDGLRRMRREESPDYLSDLVDDFLEGQRLQVEDSEERWILSLIEIPDAYLYLAVLRREGEDRSIFDDEQPAYPLAINESRGEAGYSDLRGLSRHRERVADLLMRKAR